MGLLKLRLFKPFPKASVQEALKDLPGDVIIAPVERNFMGDREGALFQEMQKALYGMPMKMYDFYAGVGGFFLAHDDDIVGFADSAAQSLVRWAQVRLWDIDLSSYP